MKMGGGDGGVVVEHLASFVEKEDSSRLGRKELSEGGLKEVEEGLESFVGFIEGVFGTDVLGK